MLRNVLRTTIAAALMVSFSAFAVAQYPGPMPPGPGNPPYTAPKGGYSSMGPAIGGAVGGAAAVAGFLYWKHTHAKLEGCVSGDGDKLVDKDNQTYSLTNKQDESLKPGERVQIVGKKSKDSSGQQAFEVRKMSKDLGSCTTTSMAQPPR
jgi:hypothetical protein